MMHNRHGSGHSAPPAYCECTMHEIAFYITRIACGIHGGTKRRALWPLGARPWPIIYPFV